MRLLFLLASWLLFVGSSACSETYQAKPVDAGVDAAAPTRDGSLGRSQDAGSGLQIPDAPDPASDAALDGDAALAPAAGACTHLPAAKDCEDGLCTIPAGCFVMGVPREAKSATAYDNQQTEVSLTHSFSIGQTEVTRAQWLGLGLPEPVVDWRVTGASTRDVPPPGYQLCLDPECPVTWVSFEDAATYANRLSEKEGLDPCYTLSGCVRNVGDNLRCASVRVNAESPYECRGYRLPTEAEWEYATKADTQTDFYSGNMGPEATTDSDCKLDKNLDRIGWYCANSGALSGAEGGKPHHVAQKQPNAFGLYDVSGNAFEWTNDCYHPDGYGKDRQTDPVGGGADPSDLTSEHSYYGHVLAEDGYSAFRVIRGGSYDFWIVLAASGRRMYMSVATQFTGFRIVRTIHTASAGAGTP